MIASPAAMPSRAAHEGEILHGGDDGQALDGAGSVEDGILEPGLGLGLLQPVGVALLVTESQRVLDDLGVLEDLVFAAVEEEFQPLPGGDLHVVAGRRDDVLVALQVLVEHHLAALGILDPEVFGDVAAPEHRVDLRADEIGDPVHGARFPFREKMGRLFGGSKAGRAHALREPADQRRHRFGRVCGQSALRIDDIGDGVDDRRADHDAVGRSADGARLLGGLDAETDADRQVGMALDALDRGRDLCRYRRAPKPVMPVIET